ncbi:MAG: hypothetical protein ACYDEJ_00020 [Desulfitobacteriaceae bacterium]
MKKEKVQKIMLLIIILFGIAYSYYTYLFIPEWSVIQSSTAQLQDRQSYYQRLLGYSAKVSEIDNEMKTLDAQRKQLISQSSSKLDKPQLLVYLYNIVKQSQVVPENVTFGQPLDKGTYQELPLTLTCSGKVNEVLSLIQNLQYSGTQRFAIQSTKLSDQLGTLQVELKLTVYVPVLPEIGTEPGPKPPYMIYPFGTGTTAQIFNE